MDEDLLALAVELRRIGQAFALATVVRCERPTSAKPGAKALIRADGSVSGWVGGACAEPVVVREALGALRDGQPRLIALVGAGGEVVGRSDGLVPYPMTCHSGGTLEIYVEPFLPRPLLVLVGHGPVVETLAALGRATDFTVAVIEPEPGEVRTGLERLPVSRSSSIVVATHGSGDEDALEQALVGPADYVSLIASRKRASAIMEILTRRGLTPDITRRLKSPAGIDIGAVTPAEIAVSILAEIVQRRRAEKPGQALAECGRLEQIARESRDPVCGMTVAMASARHRSELPSGTVYFCCPSCKEAFDREPRKYAVDFPA